MRKEIVIRIARKEVIWMSRDGRVLWTSAFVLALLVLCLLAGWRDHRAGARERELAARTVREQWLSQGEKHPHGAAHFGVYVFKPDLSLALVDPGIRPYAGTALWLEPHRQNRFKYPPAQDATPAGRLARLTAAGVLQILVPALILLLSFPAISSEREHGTLRQLLASGVTHGELAAGKLAGIGLVLSAVLVPAAALGTGALVMGAATEEIGSLALRLTTMALGYLAYFAVFLLLGVAASARATSSRAALAALLGFWVASAFIFPRAASELARRLAPTPSAEELREAIEHDFKHGLDDQASPDTREDRLIKETLAFHGVESIAALPVGFAGIRLSAGEAFTDRLYEKHLGGLYDTYLVQDRWAHLASMTGPLVALRSLSSGMAGTDNYHYRHFAVAAEQYRRFFIKRTNNIVAERGKGTGQDFRVNRSFYEGIPPFAYAPPPGCWALSNQALNVAVLAGWLSIAAVALFLSVRGMRLES